MLIHFGVNLEFTFKLFKIYIQQNDLIAQWHCLKAHQNYNRSAVNNPNKIN